MEHDRFTQNKLLISNLGSWLVCEACIGTALIEMQGLIIIGGNLITGLVSSHLCVSYNVYTNFKLSTIILLLLLLNVV